ncbi:MAG TPA: hypothetical protein VGR71_05030 [Nitrospira sp.]|nr:hypothetical protein [Nitrospira sp.]
MSGAVVALISFIGLAITVAAIFGSFRVARNTQTTTLYREAAQAWEAKARSQEDEIHELQKRDSEKDRLIAELKARVEVLQDIVTGRSMLEKLSLSVEQNNQQLRKIVTLVNELHDSFSPK